MPADITLVNLNMLFIRYAGEVYHVSIQPFN
jgi:hypothetical protein